MDHYSANRAISTQSNLVEAKDILKSDTKVQTTQIHERAGLGQALLIYCRVVASEASHWESKREFFGV
jgi:hypothetical protein